jgi:hypothetical protein
MIDAAAGERGGFSLGSRPFGHSRALFQGRDKLARVFSRV